MSSYFDEHDCEPLANGATPNHFLHIARLLIDTGYWSEAEYITMFSDRPPPPTSDRFISELPERVVRDEEPDVKCPICLKQFDQEKVLHRLPCQHEFHKECIIPWLKKTSSCPLCRFELPTDDRDYEEMKKQKKRMKEREEDIEKLHDSMFG